MKEIDAYSYQCGVMDCFNEMIKAGLKKMALAHPCQTKEERDTYIEYVKELCAKYNTYYYLDDDPLITDLFPCYLNKGTYNIIFYKDKNVIQEYVLLKKLKTQGYSREHLAYRFGHLLSYSDETIQHYIDVNDDKEK